MQRAIFYVNLGFEAEGYHLTEQYQFWIDFPDETYEELYHVWFDNNCDLNSWNCNWDGHDKLYDNISSIATEMLNEMLDKEESGIRNVPYYLVKWELSKETADAF